MRKFDTGKVLPLECVGQGGKNLQRRQGFAKAIMGAAADILRPRGVTQVSARIFSRNIAQVALMRAADATKVRTVSHLPGITI